MTADPILRLAVAADREALIALQWRASLTSDADRPHLLANPDAIDLDPEFIRDHRVVVAERGGVALGFSVLLACEDGACELDGMFVEPDCWRGGIGRALVEASAEMAQRDGAASIRVIANPTALEFYRACGFEDDGFAQTRFAPAPVMRRRLTP